MKFLVLSCNTGQGHNSAAKAICEKFISLGHECVVKDALEYASKIVSDGISESYNKIVLHTPKAFGAGYRLSKAAVYNPGDIKSVAYGANMFYSKKLCNDIIEEGYNSVICTHVFAAQALTHAKHKHGLTVPTYVVATDYSFCPFSDELDMDNYFVSMKEVLSEYTSRGIPSEKIVPSGIPVSERFAQDFSKEEARDVLRLQKDRFLCVIMSGSMGYGNVYKLIDGIVEKPVHDYDILVIAGNNTKLLKGINEKYEEFSNIAAIGYTDKVHLYMKAADLIITKPGGLSSTEAMVSNVPIILTKPIPGCETENYDTLTKYGLAIGGKNVDEAVMGFVQVMLNETVRADLIINQNRYINKNASEIICRCVLERLQIKI